MSSSRGIVLGVCVAFCVAGCAVGPPRDKDGNVLVRIDQLGHDTWRASSVGFATDTECDVVVTAHAARNVCLPRNKTLDRSDYKQDFDYTIRRHMCSLTFQCK